MGNLVSLPVPEQELVDCDVNSGNQGCSGGFTKKAFRFIKDNGLSTGEDHPYKDQMVPVMLINENARCEHEWLRKRTPINNEKSLQAAVAHQPLSVAIDAGSHAFQLYSLSSLVIVEISTMESPQSGYGEDSGKKYWLVKNSWGLDWGESGYTRMKRNSVDKEGTYGIAMQASYPVKA